LADLGLRLQGKRLVNKAAEASDWRALATLDASTRVVTSLVRAEAIRPGWEAQRVLQALLERTVDTPVAEAGLIPERYWSVRPALPAPSERDAPATEKLILQGAVLHDVHDTRDFPRVLVIDAGRVVEDGAPRELATSPASHYRALLDAEQAVAQELWSSPIWRRRWLEAGCLSASGRQQR
jgi:hypothetical protein